MHRPGTPTGTAGSVGYHTGDSKTTPTKYGQEYVEHHWKEAVIVGLEGENKNDSTGGVDEAQVIHVQLPGSPDVIKLRSSSVRPRHNRRQVFQGLASKSESGVDTNKAIM